MSDLALRAEDARDEVDAAQMVVVIDELVAALLCRKGFGANADVFGDGAGWIDFGTGERKDRSGAPRRPTQRHSCFWRRGLRFSRAREAGRGRSRRR